MKQNKFIYNTNTYSLYRTFCANTHPALTADLQLNS